MAATYLTLYKNIKILNALSIEISVLEAQKWLNANMDMTLWGMKQNY